MHSGVLCLLLISSCEKLAFPLLSILREWGELCLEREKGRGQRKGRLQSIQVTFKSWDTRHPPSSAPMRVPVARHVYHCRCDRGNQQTCAKRDEWAFKNAKEQPKQRSSYIHLWHMKQRGTLANIRVYLCFDFSIKTALLLLHGSFLIRGGGRQAPTCQSLSFCRPKRKEKKVLPIQYCQPSRISSLNNPKESPIPNSCIIFRKPPQLGGNRFFLFMPRRRLPSYRFSPRLSCRPILFSAFLFCLFRASCTLAPASAVR